MVSPLGVPNLSFEVAISRSTGLIFSQLSETVQRSIATPDLAALNVSTMAPGPWIFTRPTDRLQDIQFRISDILSEPPQFLEQRVPLGRTWQDIPATTGGVNFSRGSEVSKTVYSWNEDSKQYDIS